MNNTEWRSIKESLENASTERKTTVLGRVRAIREHKKRFFVDLTDYSGRLQLVIEKDAGDGKETDFLPRKGSYLQANGVVGRDREGNLELRVEEREVVADNTIKIQSPWEFDGTKPEFGHQMMSFPEVYSSNDQRAAILKIKADFVLALRRYFQDNRFVLVEPPILTDKTLYGKDNAITAEVHGEKVLLSQCATFELEPLALAFGKVYTISPAFRNEMSGSKRHLAEYTHLKAEALFADIPFLKNLAGRSIYHAMHQVLNQNQRELSILGVNPEIEGLRPENQEHITYDEALKITARRGSLTQWGEGLKRSDEIALTEHFGNKYVWVNFPPFISEGFPYKRLPHDRRLSMTCDLIAPHGAGEMVGVAEMTTDPEELIQNLVEKGQKQNIRHYWKYIALREAGLPPHGGIGAAPERILYGLLNLDHIRLTKPWPRYPDKRIVTPEGQELDDFGSENLRKLISEYDLK